MHKLRRHTLLQRLLHELLVEMRKPGCELCLQSSRVGDLIASNATYKPLLLYRMVGVFLCLQ